MSNTYNDDAYGGYREREEEKSFTSHLLDFPKHVKRFSVPVASDKKLWQKRIDAVPYAVGQGNPNADPGKAFWLREYAVHPVVSAAGRNTSIVCPSLTWHKPCRICQLRNQEWDKDKGARDMNFLKGTREKWRQLISLRDLEDEPEVVQLWDQSCYNFGDLYKKKVGLIPDGDWRKLHFHPVKGFTLVVSFEVGEMKGDGLKARPFSKAFDIEFVRRERPISQALIDQVPCLDALIPCPSWEDTYRAFHLEDPPTRGDQPARTVSVPVPTPVPAQERPAGNGHSQQAAPAQVPSQRWTGENPPSVPQQHPAPTSVGPFKVGDFVRIKGAPKPRLDYKVTKILRSGRLALEESYSGEPPENADGEPVCPFPADVEMSDGVPEDWPPAQNRPQASAPAPAQPARSEPARPATTATQAQAPPKQDHAGLPRVTYKGESMVATHRYKNGRFVDLYWEAEDKTLEMIPVSEVQGLPPF